MARVGSPTAVRLQRRMCLSCGFDGAAIQNECREHGWSCPRCNADLYARPPRSYAELEGLSDSSPPHATLAGDSGSRPRAAVRGRHVAPLAGPMVLRPRRSVPLLGPIVAALTGGAAVGGLTLWILIATGAI